MDDRRWPDDPDLCRHRALRVLCTFGGGHLDAAAQSAVWRVDLYLLDHSRGVSRRARRRQQPRLVDREKHQAPSCGARMVSVAQRGRDCLERLYADEVASVLAYQYIDLVEHLVQFPARF